MVLKRDGKFVYKAVNPHHLKRLGCVLNMPHHRIFWHTMSVRVELD